MRHIRETGQSASMETISAEKMNSLAVKCLKHPHTPWKQLRNRVIHPNLYHGPWTSSQWLKVAETLCTACCWIWALCGKCF